MALKTTIYKVDKTHSKAGDHQNHHHWTDNIRNTFKLGDEDYLEEGMDCKCAICLCNFCDGDRVGDLTCGHVFHKDCLKAWLRIRNQCPLCNANDVAQPRHTQIQDSTENTSEGQ
uniref:RING-type domain-containing protein n=1 Tax=Cyclophora tenuis TaxID=216820 RepID=A0A7S1D0N2_CYCTE